MHLVCFPGSYLKSTSEFASCLEFLYCFLVRLHRWVYSSNEKDFPESDVSESIFNDNLCISKIRMCIDDACFIVLLIPMPKIYTQHDAMFEKNIWGLSLFLECAKSRFNKEPDAKAMRELSYREFFTISAFLVASKWIPHGSCHSYAPKVRVSWLYSRVPCYIRNYETIWFWIIFICLKRKLLVDYVR